jgi:hypothetical protein
MKTVYIASPYTIGDVAKNVSRSIFAAEELRKLGFLPFCPLLTHFWHFLSPHPKEYWMSMDMEWLDLCDCILRLPGESTGADEEVKYMLSKGKPVFYSMGELLAYLAVA